ncbi:MAG: anti-sigma factor [Saprospiraceae bacterium]|jgi:hypothetical protein
MRVPAFITSGVLEKYVLGMATEEEIEDVLEMASQHLEIKEELAAIRKTMKGYILSHKVAPPPDLINKVMAIGVKQAAPSTKHDPATRSISPSFTAPKREKAESGNNKLMGIATAALSIALIAACFTAYTFFQDVEGAKKETADALDQVEEVKKELATAQRNTMETQAKLDFYLDRDNQLSVLKGTNRAPNAKAVIYWNAVSKSASLDVAKLPPLASGSIAVLWANSGRSARKLGVLAANDPGDRTSVSYIDGAESFFVTEENSPTVDQPNRSRILMTGQ